MKYWRRCLTWLSRFGLMLVLLGLSSVGPALAQAPPAGAQPPWSQGSPAPPLPHLLARAAVLMERDSGRVLFAIHPNERLAVASLTKMMTALVAVDQAWLEQPIRATEYSRSIPTVIGLDPGDVLTLEEMLYGLILRSGNDAALAIAEDLGGGNGPAAIERFVDKMNQKAREMGLRNTHFVNPNGLDADGHYSSAYDMAQISRAYLQHPILARIAATTQYQIDKPPGWFFANINGFLGAYPGADGIKTGYEDRAGHCLAASATHDGHRLIAVILNSDQSIADAARLMDYGFALLGWLPARDSTGLVAE